jgi:hypothetical protein
MLGIQHHKTKIGAACISSPDIEDAAQFSVIGEFTTKYFPFSSIPPV